VVFGEGNPRAPLVLVGEGPGETEDATGRPFVGRAGQLLDKALLENGLTREDVYICNTVKCRACDWSTGKPVNRAPTNEETESCRQWLLPQLALIAPKVILCIGAPSAKNLIKKDFKITQERGKFFKFMVGQDSSYHEGSDSFGLDRVGSDLSGSKSEPIRANPDQTELIQTKCILACLHPAYILRQANISGDGGYSLLVADIAKAWDTAIRLQNQAHEDSPEPATDEPPQHVLF
jgi:DNA polymerase